MKTKIRALPTRNQLCDLINENGLKLGAEIGVCAGGFSQVLLEFSKLDKLYSIDPWHESCEGLPAGMSSLATFDVANTSMWRYWPRSVLIRQTSLDAALLIPWNFLDFVYIDGCHKYDAVTLDLDLWWKRAKSGALFAGHDYNPSSPEVRQAVDEHVARYQCELFLTDCDFMFDVSGVGPEAIRSWYMVKL